jgi:hypothetical protein
MKTNGSSQWTLFRQLGDDFMFDAPAADVNTTVLGTTATLFTMSVPPAVQVMALLRGYMTHATLSIVLIHSPDEAVSVANSPAGNVTMGNQVAGNAGIFTVNVRTNTSQQIRAVATVASTTLGILTYGWIDRRGRDA